MKGTTGARKIKDVAKVVTKVKNAGKLVRKVRNTGGLDTGARILRRTVVEIGSQVVQSSALVLTSHTVDKLVEGLSGSYEDKLKADLNEAIESHWVEINELLEAVYAKKISNCIAVIRGIMNEALSHLPMQQLARDIMRFAGTAISGLSQAMGKVGVSGAKGSIKVRLAQNEQNQQRDVTKEAFNEFKAEQKKELTKVVQKTMTEQIKSQILSPAINYVTSTLVRDNPTKQRVKQNTDTDKAAGKLAREQLHNHYQFKVSNLGKTVNEEGMIENHSFEGNNCYYRAMILTDCLLKAQSHEKADLSDKNIKTLRKENFSSSYSLLREFKVKDIAPEMGRNLFYCRRTLVFEKERDNCFV
jgi:hypothetical protein